MLESIPGQFTAGMLRDVSPLRQKEGTYHSAINAVHENESGFIGELSSEEGTVKQSALPAGYQPIGTVLLDDNSRIHVLTNDTYTIIGHETTLGYTTLIKSSCFGLKTYKAAELQFRLKSGCDRIIYITDGISPIYSVNLDSLRSYLSDDLLADPLYTTDQQRIDYANDNDAWVCDRFRNFLPKSLPLITVRDVVDSGGSLKVGSYQFAIRYLDSDKNPTNWFYITHPVPVVDENLTRDYRLIDGGIAGTGTSGSGDAALPPTNKSIILDLRNLDEDFTYYQIGVLATTAGTGRLSDVYIKRESAITGDTDSYVFAGIDDSVDTVGTVNEITVAPLDMYTCEHIKQIDNRMLYMNTTGKPIDNAKFQRQASKIISKYTIKTGKKEDITDYSPKSAKSYTERRSYMRDEIYAFGIVWVFKDGTLSPVYHIPGRPKDYNPFTCTALPTTGNGQTTTVTRKCLKIVEVLDIRSSLFRGGRKSSFTIKYTIDGVEKTYEKVIAPWIDGQSPLVEYYIECSVSNDLNVTHFDFRGEGKTATLVKYFIEDDTQEGVSVGGAQNIPAATTGWDSTEYPYSGDEVNYSHAGFVEGEVIPRWKSFNTAYKLTATEGLMGYYECDDDIYPDIKNCAGDSIWGTDSCGNSLANTPIRHHRFPDASLEPIQTDDEIRQLGIVFSNIEPPEEYADQVEYYFIVRAQRTDANKTVIDKGILDRAEYYKGNPLEEDDGSFFSYFRSDTALNNQGEWGLSKRVYTFHSPRGLFNREFYGGEYMKLERYYPDKDASVFSSQGQFNLYLFHGEGSVDNQYSRLIEESKYIDHIAFPEGGDPVTTTLANYRLNSYLGSTHINANLLIDELDHTITNSQSVKTYYAAIKVQRSVYGALDALRYQKAQESLSSATSTEVFGGDTFISKLDLSLQDYDGSRSYMSMYVESEINSELRHNGDDLVDTYFQGSYSLTQAAPDLLEWIFRFQTTEEFKNSEKQLNEYVVPDYFAYNPDFSKQNDEFIYVPVPFTFNYCSKCNDKHPYRIAYSEQSFQEETVDNFRVVLVNNYTDLMGDQGPITNAFIDKDRLLVHAGKALWHVQTRPNEITSSEGTIFVGAGEILSIPPRKLVTTPYGYAGCIDKWSTVTTEHGTVFVDSRTGKVFILKEGLDELSQNGLSAFFEEELPIQLYDQFKQETGEAYYVTEPIGDYGVGVRAVYDPRYKRLILHKRDFLMRSEMLDKFDGVSADGTDISEGRYYFNSTTRAFEIRSGTEVTKLKMYDRTLFENRSFTISYNLMLGSWTSFHSYMPSYMYNDHDSFYSYITAQDYTHKHSKGPYQEYYGTKHPFVIDYIAVTNPSQEKMFGSIQYIAYTRRVDSTNRGHVLDSSVTFDEFYAYTSNQITATCALAYKNTPYQTLPFNKDISVVHERDGIYRISQNLRDIAVDRTRASLFTRSWADTTYTSYFNADNQGNGYIDRVPNDEIRDINKDVYTRGRLKDKYLGVRMSFNPQDDYQMIMQLTSVVNKRDA